MGGGGSVVGEIGEGGNLATGFHKITRDFCFDGLVLDARCRV